MTEAEEKSERAPARRGAALAPGVRDGRRRATCWRIRRASSIAVEDQRGCRCRRLRTRARRLEAPASAPRLEHEVLEAKRAATEARGELARVVEADSEREREASRRRRNGKRSSRARAEPSQPSRARTVEATAARVPRGGDARDRARPASERMKAPRRRLPRSRRLELGEDGGGGSERC